jgi:type VI secretion system secreted protein VgrG
VLVQFIENDIDRPGYNQLVFDDTEAQGRVQLRMTHAATEPNPGHLVDTADNYRGSLRAQGAKLRTDAYGALRASAACWCRATRSATTPARDQAELRAMLTAVSGMVGAEGVDAMQRFP